MTAIYIMLGALFCGLMCMLAEFVLLVKEMDKLKARHEQLEDQSINLVMRLNRQIKDFEDFRDGEAKDIAEALEKSQKREEAFYEGFTNIINYSVDMAYGRKGDEEHG